jgi:hypothetical protein
MPKTNCPNKLIKLRTRKLCDYKTSSKLIRLQGLYKKEVISPLKIDFAICYFIRNIIRFSDS